MKKRNIYVLRSHLLNEHVMGTFKQIQLQLGKENVYLLYDETRNALTIPHNNWKASENLDSTSIISINEEDCQSINNLHNHGTYSGSMYKVEAHVFACYKAIRRDYDYLWLIEYDVYCNDFKAALSSADDIEADMLTKIYTAKYNWRTKKWFWWDKLEGEISKIPMKDRRRCFFPINRFSKKFLHVIEQNLSESSGYCEVYFPTLCHINGLKLKSLPKHIFGTFRYQPAIPYQEIESIKKEDYRLYHPVK